MQVCKEHDVLLIVDEAHGAHLGHHPAFAPSAMQQGADVSVQSAHKNLRCLTQGALLHLSAHLAPRSAARIKRWVRMQQTSSPSYLLMAALNVAIELAADARSWCEPMRASALLRHGLQGVQLPVLSSTRANPVDPLRVTCWTSTWQLSGFELLARLERAGVSAEMASSCTVTFALGQSSCQDHSQRALRALTCLRRGVTATDRVIPPDIRRGDAPANGAAPTVICPAAVIRADIERVRLGAALGRVCAAPISVYPPGVPCISAGEHFTQAVIDRLREASSQGGRVTGCRNDFSDVQVVT